MTDQEETYLLAADNLASALARDSGRLILPLSLAVAITRFLEAHPDPSFLAMVE